MGYDNNIRVLYNIDNIDLTGGTDQMTNKTITLKVTLDLDKEWAKNQTKAEVLDSLRNRMDSSLGFRGQIREFQVDRKKV